MRQASREPARVPTSIVLELGRVRVQRARAVVPPPAFLAVRPRVHMPNRPRRSWPTGGAAGRCTSMFRARAPCVVSRRANQVLLSTAGACPRSAGASRVVPPPAFLGPSARAATTPTRTDARAARATGRRANLRAHESALAAELQVARADIARASAKRPGPALLGTPTSDTGTCPCSADACRPVPPPASSELVSRVRAPGPGSVRALLWMPADSMWRRS